MGVSLRSSSNDEGSSRVWMALLEQHSPSSPVFHNLRRFIDAISPTASTRQPRGNSRCQSELRHNHSPLIPIPNTLTCLPYIHPPITSIPLLPNIHPISLLLLSIELHPRTFNDPTTRVRGEVNLPATPLLSCCL